MWIAEGFIPQQQNKTMEHTAEMFLKDLVQRSMILVSKRDSDGSIKRCRIHDVLHDLAIKKAREENFLVVFPTVDAVQNCRETRRLAIHDTRPLSEQPCGELLASAVPKLRSLFYLGQVPNISQLVRLKVLNNLGDDSYYYQPNNFGKLSQLRYVQLDLKVGEKNTKYFGKFIGDMRFLQTLNLGQKVDCELPDCVWHIITLRHVLFYPSWSWTSGPPSSIDLTHLQTLSGVHSRESWAAQGAPKLPNVTILGIVFLKESQWDATIILLDTMKHLISLNITGWIPLKIIDMRRFPFYAHLQNLYLDQYNVDTEKHPNQIALDVGMLPKYLIKLELIQIKFKDDPIPVLEKLENLRFLNLQGSELLRLCCSTGGFSQLEKLILRDLDKLEEWTTEEGAMPRLKKLKIMNCHELHVPLGLQYLTVLQELQWMDSEISETKENEISNICKHVPSVLIF
ncbi:Disease resistance protein (CC-NBS-LRR class) family [Rhynchospora pubera]|uniref:Disease resistance protein (CC-NBS-LRR class) family n=1 Tax=Rhynchospora pubera TaxID=906938 RepID=A0AAV8BYF4_9POAL|nr:Disease resistance protein (CC-NBS-LRR class) family [Rhynchospora pubera]